MLRTHGNPWIIASLALALLCFLPLELFQLNPAAAQSSNDQVIYIDQGWSMAVRETWYQMSQGSAVLDYDIFLNLEVAVARNSFGRMLTAVSTASSRKRRIRGPTRTRCR